MSKKAKYGKHYSKEWEKDPQLKDWLQPVPGDNTKAFHNSASIVNFK